ncbi:MAG: alpha-galactosidase [Ruminococcaceae bacterium]|nr:alpha-galactosidase [Oscillospiraceae bacterium]
MVFDINKFATKIICENEVSDAVVEIVSRENELDVFLCAKEDRPEFVELHWNTAEDGDVFVLGDAWERSYGDLEFRKISENDRFMPWYFIATDKRECFCFGVKTQANSYVCFRYDENGITALLDVRNGGNGVYLDGRKLCIATFVYSHYNNGNVYENLCDYCRKLCDNPILPKERVYGGNNWYYAYGDSSFEQIISDAKLQVELSCGNENKPFEVVDDCWQIHSCAGPWLPNEKFGDMKKLADEIKKIGARPGIWVRLLHNKDASITDEMKIQKPGKEKYLDPTREDVQDFIKADLERIKGWGYELIKHDFSTFDLFGSWGKDLTSGITDMGNWHFYDKTKTNAEITVDFYKLIKDTVGDMIIIGCNTVSHLSAGLVHLSRTGDDTSGKEWERTKKMGVNTLAFRLAQNEAFYMCDADCVGILDDYIPWEKNRQWLHLLSYSNTPLFISCTDKIDDEIKDDIKEAYKTYNIKHTIKPIDIFETKTPSQWEIDGEKVLYEW